MRCNGIGDSYWLEIAIQGSHTDKKLESKLEKQNQRIQEQAKNYEQKNSES